jgi:hypothetical protein
MIPARPAVHDDELEHLVAGVHLDAAGVDLALQRLVGAEQELLAGLTLRVERAGDLHAAERAVVEQAAVLAGERHALRHALVDDLHADLGEAVHVRLAGAEVAALDGVVEQPLHGVAVVAVVLRGVDPALRGDRVRPARAVLVAEARHLVAGLGQRRRGRAAGQAGAHHDDLHLALVRRVDQLDAEPAALPPGLDGPVGGGGVDDRVTDREVAVHAHVQDTNPKVIDSGTTRKPTASAIATTFAVVFSATRLPPRVRPSDCTALHSPWRRCSVSARIDST